MRSNAAASAGRYLVAIEASTMPQADDAAVETVLEFFHHAAANTGETRGLRVAYRRSTSG